MDAIGKLIVTLVRRARNLARMEETDKLIGALVGRRLDPEHGPFL